jgi:hypothetical protein
MTYPMPAVGGTAAELKLARRQIFHPIPVTAGDRRTILLEMIRRT